MVGYTYILGGGEGLLWVGRRRIDVLCGGYKKEGRIKRVGC